MDDPEHPGESRPIAGALLGGRLLQALEQLAHRDAVVQGSARQERDDQLGQRLGERFGPVPLRGHPTGLHGGDPTERQDADDEEATDGHAEPVPPDEPADAVSGRVAVGDDRLATEEAPQVVGQLTGGPVAAFRIPAQRHPGDPGEVAPQHALELPDRGIPKGRDLVGRFRSPRRSGGRGVVERGGGRTLRIAQHGPLQLRSRRVFQPVGESPAEELIEQEAEGIDVGRGRDRAAGELFRRRVERRRQPALGLRLAKREVEDVRVEQLGDAEVEQLHLAGLGDEDVRRLQIPVHDQVRVGVLDGLADLEQKLHPALHRQPTPVAVLEQRRSVDELHHEVGEAVLGDAAVEERRDVRVLEVGHHLPFEAEPLQNLLGSEHRAHDLDRDLAVVGAVGPLPEVDPPHPARTELLEHAVRPEP